jgi:FlaA1/EpsC-like NDP-sugar epimerase
MGLTSQEPACGGQHVPADAWLHQEPDCAVPADLVAICPQLGPPARPVTRLADGYRGNVVCVTGAGGSIGLRLCRDLLALRPRRIVLIEASEPALVSAERALSAGAAMQGVTLVPVLGSVCDATLMHRLLAREAPQFVLHAAAHKHVAQLEVNVRAAVLNNTLGTATLARAARESGVAGFVLVSTDKAVRPVSVMGMTKRLAEWIVADIAARSHGRCGFSIVRFGNVWGSSGSVVPRLRAQIRAGGPLTVTDLRAERYFMSAAAASDMVLSAALLGGNGEIFLPDLGAPLRVATLVRALLREADLPPGCAGPELAITGLRPGEKLRERLSEAGSRPRRVAPGLFRVTERRPSEIEVAAALRHLRDLCDTGDDRAMAAALRFWTAPRAGRDRSEAGGRRMVAG